ncbi:MAG: hypothetical protein JXQ27_14445, partial [Acidobacteria bacterium]|nr:hypothetical protein [Acidobacteriota bacterium]
MRRSRNNGSRRYGGHRQRCLGLFCVLAGLLAAGAAAQAPGSATGTFRDQQRRFPRVRAAYAAVEVRLQEQCAAAEVDYPPRRIFLRAFKREAQLEVWGAATASSPFRLIAAYPVCAASGTLGPKRHQGDLQVPEGVYHVDRFNPASRFHLSLGIDYPNRSDRIRKDRPDPGGDIFIHGSCVTIGCLPITDEGIRELYILAVEARNAGQRRIPVHIFPTRLDDPGWAWLQDRYADQPDRLAFWRELRPVFAYFERHRQVPRPMIDGQGCYV